MLRRNGPVVKSVESVLRLEGSLWGEGFVEEVGLETSDSLRQLPVFDELCKIADDELFGRAMRLSSHVLHALIPPQSSASQRYNLRHRPHLLQLPSHTTRLSDSNFITRMLYKGKY